jgi:tetratricopeptide (TPR) repeat protein
MFEEDRLKLKEPVVQPTLKVSDSPEPKDPLQNTSEQHQSVQTATPPGQGDAISGNGPAQTSSAATSQTYLTAPAEALQALIRHPDTPEDQWVEACAELSRREQEPPNAKGDARPKRTRRLIVFSSLLLLFCGAASFPLYHQSSGPGAGPIAAVGGEIQTKKPTDYMVGASKYMQMMWKQKMMVTVGQAIYERSWSESEAAKNLQVSGQKMSSLFRDKMQDLSLEDLSEMATAMGIPLPSASKGSIEYSPSLEPTKKENADAIAFYTRALSLDDKNPGTYKRRAEAFEYLKEYERAIEDLTSCIKLEPDRPYLLEARAQVYSHAGKNEIALKELNELATKFPNYDIYQARSIVYMEMGKYEQSIQDSTTAISNMKTQRPGPYYNRAVCYEKLGKFKEAIADYDKTLESDPSYNAARERAEILRKKL